MSPSKKSTEKNISELVNIFSNIKKNGNASLLYSNRKERKNSSDLYIKNKEEKNRLLSKKEDHSMSLRNRRREKINRRNSSERNGLQFPTVTHNTKSLGISDADIRSQYDQDSDLESESFSLPETPVVKPRRTPTPIPKISHPHSHVISKPSVFQADINNFISNPLYQYDLSRRRRTQSLPARLPKLDTVTNGELKLPKINKKSVQKEPRIFPWKSRYGNSLENLSSSYRSQKNKNI